MKIDIKYEINENGITFFGVSNLDSKKIEHAEKLAIFMLDKINKKYSTFGGNRNSIIFFCDLTEEEAKQIIERI